MSKRLTLTTLTQVTSHPDPSAEGEARSLEEEPCNATTNYYNKCSQCIPQGTESHLPKEEHAVESELHGDEIDTKICVIVWPMHLWTLPGVIGTDVLSN